MDNLILDESKHTPRIVCNGQKGEISIVGKACHEDTFEYYEPVMQWIEDYFNDTPKKVTTINLEITSFNANGSILFFDLLDYLESICDSHNIVVNWIFDKDNEDGRITGEELVSDFDALQINLVSK